MTTIHSTPAALVSKGARIATIVAVAGMVSAAWLAAGQESRTAVRTAAAAIGPKTLYVTLPTVEIVGRREAASTALAGTAAAAGDTL